MSRIEHNMALTGEAPRDDQYTAKNRNFLRYVWTNHSVARFPECQFSE